MRSLIAVVFLLTACGDSATINIIDWPDTGSDAPINLWPDAPSDAPDDRMKADAGVGALICGDTDPNTSDMCQQNGRCDDLACTKGEAWLYDCIGARPDIEGCKKRGTQWCCPAACVRNANSDPSCTAMFPDAHTTFSCAAYPKDAGIVVTPAGCHELGPFARGPDYVTFCCP